MHLPSARALAGKSGPQPMTPLVTRKPKMSVMMTVRMSVAWKQANFPMIANGFSSSGRKTSRSNISP